MTLSDTRPREASTTEVEVAAEALARWASVGGRLFLVGDTGRGNAGDRAYGGRTGTSQGSVFTPLTGPDPVGAARELATPGDVIVALGRREDPVAADLAARGRAWGIVSVWLCPGPRPPAGAADHVLTCATDSDDEGDTAEAVLAELADAVGRHAARPDLPPPTPPGVECTDDICITCSDEGRWAEIVEPPAEWGEPARARTASGVEDVDVTLVGEVARHDLVLVHAGSALSVLDPTADLPDPEPTGAAS